MSLALDPTGRILASGGTDNTIKLWDIATGRELRTLTGHDALLTSVDFSPDGSTLLSASRDRTIRLWDVSGVVAVRGASSYSRAHPDSGHLFHALY